MSNIKLIEGIERYIDEELIPNESINDATMNFSVDYYDDKPIEIDEDMLYTWGFNSLDDIFNNDKNIMENFIIIEDDIPKARVLVLLEKDLPSKDCENLYFVIFLPSREISVQLDEDIDYKKFCCFCKDNKIKISITQKKYEKKIKEQLDMEKNSDYAYFNSEEIWIYFKRFDGSGAETDKETKGGKVKCLD